MLATTATTGDLSDMPAVTKKGRDERRICPECGEEFLWSATQRFWFYRRHEGDEDAIPTCSRRCRTRLSGRRRRVFDDLERRCANCGGSFTWTSRQQYKFYYVHGRETERQPCCSRRCTRALSVRRKFGAHMPGPWAYSPEERACTVCGTKFLWTAQQQWSRARKVARGDVRFPDLSPACSRSHAMTLSKRMVKETV